MNSPITCIITDDEPFSRRGLKRYIEQTEFLKLEAICEDAFALGAALRQKPVDLLFLDIEMPQLTGLDFLKSARNPPKVIITTAFEQFALQGYELNVLDYLLKPISYERFAAAAEKARDYFGMRGVSAASLNYIFIKVEGELQKLYFEDIEYIEAMENYLAIFTAKKKMIIHSTIKSFMAKLPPGFIQTHKSYIVCLDKVSHFNGSEVMVGSRSVPVSRNQKRTVMERWTKPE